MSIEPVTPYPPGIPTVAPGERYTEETIEYLEEVVAAGASVDGASNPSLGTLCVVGD